MLMIGPLFASAQDNLSLKLIEHDSAVQFQWLADNVDKANPDKLKTASKLI